MSSISRSTVAIHLPFWALGAAHAMLGFRLEPFYGAVQAIQATLSYRASRDFKELGTVYKVKRILNAADFYALIWGMGQVVLPLSRKYVQWLSKAVPGHGVFSGLARVMGKGGGMIAGCGLAYSWLRIVIYSVKRINQAYELRQRYPTIDICNIAEGRKRGIGLSWEKPANPQAIQFFHAMMVTVNAVLTLFSSSSFFYAFMAVFSGYNLYQATCRDWLNITRVCSFADFNFTVKFVYSCLVRQASQIPGQSKDRCVSCEKDAQPDQSYVFPSHLIHQACLITRLALQSDELLPRIYTIKMNERLTNYEIDIRKSNAMGCPSLAGQQFCNSLEVQLKEDGQPRFKDVAINWIDS
jgi:hypothetical protein